MAFRTNKVPAIEERTVSGSSVSFNSAFALPLKACKVSFSATQASGTPSPSTPLPISGVSAIGLTANSTPVSVSLGDTRYGGELDVLNGVLSLDHLLFTIDETINPVAVEWLATSYGVGWFYQVNWDLPIIGVTEVFDGNCDILKPVKYNDIYGHGYTGACIAITSSATTKRVYVWQNDTSLTTNALIKEWTGNNNINITYPLAEPITIQLSANELSSIIGNNTFSTDTGTLEITFADLQEKSASGGVATFNTALAMPLASCNIAVNAWQEGSGDPSPVNVRGIHGFDKVRVGMVDFNQQIQNGNFVDDSVWTGYYGSLAIANNKGTLTCRDGSAFPSIRQAINMVQNHKYLFVADFTTSKDTTVLSYYGTSYNFSQINTQAGVKTRVYAIFINTSSVASDYLQIYCNRANPRTMEAGDTCIYENINLFDLTAMFGENIANYLYNLERQTAGAGVALFKQIFYKDYYAYNVGGTWVSVASVNGDSYPDYAQIQLGQEVYGAEVDVVNGVAHVTYITERIDHVDSVLPSYIKSDACDGFITFTNCPNIASGSSQYNILCNVLERAISEYGIWARVGYPNMFMMNGKQIHLNIANDLLGITDYTQETTTNAKAKMNEWLSNNVVMLNRPLLTPFDIQLTPTQIATIIGNNTIFADTGDVDLTYKDLDIAKRGNFREVFKLPS